MSGYLDKIKPAERDRLIAIDARLRTLNEERRKLIRERRNIASRAGCRVTYAKGGAEYCRARRLARLPESHRTVLSATACSATGLVRFASKRVKMRVEHDGAGRVVVTAIGAPERFLLARGLIEEAAERRVYRITKEGREAVG